VSKGISNVKEATHSKFQCLTDLNFSLATGHNFLHKHFDSQLSPQNYAFNCVQMFHFGRCFLLAHFSFSQIMSVNIS
jgi:hypothetical protein